MTRGIFILGLIILVLILRVTPAHAKVTSEQVIADWYKLVLQLVRHTPTYSPPVASRSFSYLGITAHEAVAVLREDLVSLAGQVNDLKDLPTKVDATGYDEAIVVDAALAHAVQQYFANTGPSGQRALSKMSEKMEVLTAEGLSAETVVRSRSLGEGISKSIHAWSLGDGRATIANMGFPTDYVVKKTPAAWVPTNQLRLQQAPLLPDWGETRSFAMPNGKACPLPDPLLYSEENSSAFYKEAVEVIRIRRNLTKEQKMIARFWSDDPMLSPTPPGHWISIFLRIATRENVKADRMAEILARLGIAMADAFIGCWQTKYETNLLRPITYIRRVIDPNWEPLLNTPPFPEYPSGHSVQSAAAAEVLTQAFGENFSFEDATHARDGLAPRTFTSFKSAAQEAAISRLYGGIHFRTGVEQGLAQGQCIGQFATRLKFKK